MGDLSREQIIKQIRRRALGFLARAAGPTNPGLPDFTFQWQDLTAYRNGHGVIVVHGTDNPREIALMQDRTEAAWDKLHGREHRQVAATQHPLPVVVLQALVFAYIALCDHAHPDHPWPRHVDYYASRLAKAQCDPSLHTHIVNATRAQREHARAVALEAWFPGHHGKNTL